MLQLNQLCNLQVFKKDIEKVVCEYLGIDFEEREQWLKRREELQQLKIKLEHKVTLYILLINLKITLLLIEKIMLLYCSV